jgi:hypothetical protein
MMLSLLLSLQKISMMRSRILFLVTARAPYLVRQLSSDQKLCYDFLLSSWAEALRGAGYCALPIGMDYADEDFIDLSHFSEDSVTKFSREVGMEVKKMAGQMGWINEK